MDGLAGLISLKKGEKNLAVKTFLATGMLQHRGKKAAGIAIADEKRIYPEHKQLGAIGDVRPEVIETFQALNPIAAIGNVGYTKNKIPTLHNAEPIRIKPKNNSSIDMMITMDGYLVKEDDLKAKLENDYYFETQNKTEVIGALLHKYITKEGVSFEAGKKLVDKLHGRATFALVALVNDGKQTYLIALNDDRAFEPLCYGKINDTFVISSESISHRLLEGRSEREFKGAEMIICSPKEDPKIQRLREEKIMSDIFQGAYFGYPGAIFNEEQEKMLLRMKLGHELVKYYGHSDAEIVVANPESGWGVSVGIAEELVRKGIIKPTDAQPLALYPGIIKNSQAVRTFQEASAQLRKIHVNLKFGGSETILSGKRVAMGDDSIVKGSVSEGGSVWWAYNSGAKYLEFWVSYGPMLFPSFKEWHRGEECLHELAVQRAYKNDNPYDKSVEEINEKVAKMIKVDKVFYNKKELIEKVTGPGSFQALDASYPIDEEFWPDFIHEAVNEYRKYN